MSQSVQSAIVAVKRGDKKRAMELLMQALTVNPNDLDAMLVLADLVEQPEHKRQIFNRMLTVEPANKIAREGLLRLDHQIIGGAPTGTGVFANMQTTQPVLVKNSFTNWVKEVKESPTVKSQIAIEHDSYAIIGKPLVFKYPLFWRILMYFFVVFFGCVGLLIASQNIINSLPFLVLAAMMGFSAMIFFPQVEVSEVGIRTSGIFSDSQIHWDEITEMKSVPMKRRLELSKRNGGVLNVSTQVSGYPRIVEILRQRRPDLFGGNPIRLSSGNSHSPPYQSSSFFSEARTFGKSFFKLYGILFIVIPFFFFALWIALTEPPNRVGALIGAVFCGIMICLPFFQVSSIKLEPDKLTIETMFEEKVVSAQDINEIKMQTVRRRYGRVTNFVNIILVTGRNYPLQGFSDGDETIYGTLLNWWESYRNE
jgi:hypothetical protein